MSEPFEGFWNRLKMFVEKVEVADAMSEEEKQMILNTCNEMQVKEDNSIAVRGEFLFKLESKQQWISRVPRCLPDKIRFGEQWVWVDKNGNTFECGADFIEADKHDTYPCKVYRLITVASVWKK